jgi:dUTP pyrophosphatase
MEKQMTQANYQIQLDAQTAMITGLQAQVAVLADQHQVQSSTIKVVVTDERVGENLPEVQTVDSAGFDLRAYPRGRRHWVDIDAANQIVKKGFEDDMPLDSIVLGPGEQAIVSTGLRVWIDKPGYAGFMFARSGMGVKGLVLGNGTGVIDSDYQGDLKMCLWNRSDEAITINAGDRVAQLVIMPVLTGYKMEVVESFETETERGTGGFGSTGVQ